MFLPYCNRQCFIFFDKSIHFLCLFFSYPYFGTSQFHVVIMLKYLLVKVKFLLEIKKYPDGNTERYERHEVADQVKGGGGFYAGLRGLAERHIPARCVVRVVVPCAVVVTQSAGVLCNRTKYS